ncbi:MAG: phage major capsid protein [Pseudonocardia sp.]|nr:phage major capsid protein [Pseudonocardia sp.]
MTKTVIPTSAAELEELLGDRDKIQAMLRDEPASFSDLLTNYTRAVRDQDQGLQVQVREQVQATIADMIREDPEFAAALKRPDMRPTPNAASTASAHNPAAVGAQLDGQFRSAGELVWLLGAERKGDRGAIERMAKLRNEFSSTIPSEGGFLIPEEYRSELLSTAQASAIVRPRATVIPMGAPRVKMPMIEDTNHTEGWYGGILTFWEAEGAALQESAPKFGEVALDAHTLTAYTEVPNTLLADSAISLEGFVGAAFPGALRRSEDQAFLFGAGAGKPLGVLNAGNAALVSQAKETGQPADTIVWENVIKMFARMLPESLGSAVWIANINTFPELATMALSVGTGGSAVWLNNGAEGPPMTILGRPVIFHERMPTLGDAGDISFVDLSYYLIGDRQQMSAMWSEHFRFNINSTAYRILQRLDGRPWLKNAITPEKGAATLSPFVQLAARA